MNEYDCLVENIEWSWVTSDEEEVGSRGHLVVKFGLVGEISQCIACLFAKRGTTIFFIRNVGKIFRGYETSWFTN